MKKLLFVALGTAILSTSSFTVRGQTPTQHESLKINQFDLLKTGNSPSKNTIILSSSRLLSKFGRPNQTLIEYAEMDQKNMTHFVYTDADVWVMDDDVIAVKIKGKAFAFQLTSTGLEIKVGDDNSVLSTAFPQSWRLREENRVFVGVLTNEGTSTDANIIFSYEPTTNKIKEIFIQEE